MVPIDKIRGECPVLFEEGAVHPRCAMSARDSEGRGEEKEKLLLARETAAHFVGLGTNDRLRDREHQRFSEISYRSTRGSMRDGLIAW